MQNIAGFACRDYAAYADNRIAIMSVVALLCLLGVYFVLSRKAGAKKIWQKLLLILLIPVCGIIWYYIIGLFTLPVACF